MARGSHLWGQSLHTLRTQRFCPRALLLAGQSKVHAWSSAVARARHLLLQLRWHVPVPRSVQEQRALLQKKGKFGHFAAHLLKQEGDAEGEKPKLYSQAAAWPQQAAGATPAALPSLGVLPALSVCLSLCPFCSGRTISIMLITTVLGPSFRSTVPIAAGPPLSCRHAELPRSVTIRALPTPSPVNFLRLRKEPRFGWGLWFQSVPWAPPPLALPFRR